MGKYIENYRRAERQRRFLQDKMERECRRSGHAMPVTRRDFLARGFLSGASMVFLPSLATTLSRAAHAECVIDNNPGIGAGKIPFLAFDQGGGANIAGSNVMVGGVGGQEDFLSAQGYAKLGLPDAIIPQNVGVNRDFGLAMHPNSALLRGMQSKTSLATRNNTNGYVIPARSENDTGNNPHNPVYGIARSGANGEFVATIGTSNSESGGRSAAPESMIQAELRPVKISSRNEAIGIGGGDDPDTPTARIAQAVSIISELKLGNITEDQAAKELVKCGYDKSFATFNTPITSNDLDPEQDARLLSLFPNGEIQSGDFRKVAAAMKVVVNGYGGAGTIEYGGRDYHQNPRPDTDQKDFIVGQAIGASLEYAASLGKPLMIYCFSDGAVSADINMPEDDGNGVTKYRWRSDNSQTAASFVLVYNPNGRPVLRNGNASQQIGYYRADGNVETASSPFANNVTLLSEMVVLNYLALHGEQANFNSVLPNSGLGSGAALDPFIAFNSIV